MNKSYKSFKEIDKEAIEIRAIIGKLSIYYGHTHYQKNFEPLSEHTIKTKEYFLRIIELNRLEKVIDRLISRLDFNNASIGNFLKKLFFNAIIFHDFGKTNPNFQVYIHNNAFKYDEDIKIGTEHSFLSAYVLLNWFSSEIQLSKQFSNEEKYIVLAYLFLFTIPILKHHSGYIAKDYNFDRKKTYSIHKFVSLFGIKMPYDFIKNLIQNEALIWDVFKGFDFFPLFALLKLNYSLLTASDYYATNEYMNDISYSTEEDFGLITEKFKMRLLHYFENNDKTKYNGELLRNTEKYIAKSLDELREKSNDNLNFLRQKLGAEVLLNIEKYKDDRVFYIEAPTGSGKTNMSMIAVRKLLELHTQINKVFYVFPFTTLITQTAKAIKDTMGLSDSEVAQVHSKAGFQSKKYDNEEDAKYGNEKRNEIDNLFVNYPFTLLTHIKFFDILKSNKKNTNYLLHRLANSIVIIDELQSYNPSEWDKVKYFISQYAGLFNIRFILMSATLPKIDEIKLADFQFIPFKTLIPNARQYLQNPNFAERIDIKTELLNKKDMELKELAEILFDKSKKYAQNRKDKFNGSIYTIIEFIFKKSASEFYEIVNKNDFFDEIFVLSGTIIEPRRKYIIEYLKDENNRKKKILLITTQVVEAGVDIDMDLGFKNQSLIDSDEQLAGRINRNVNKKDCELWLFKHDTPKSIYGKDFRYEVTRNFSQDFIENILTKKDFGKLYSEVFKKIESENKSDYKKNFDDYLEDISKLNFRKINEEFKLIDSENASVYVPENIDIKCYKKENNFSEKEIQFIMDNGCFNGENELLVSGEKIWELYVSLIRNKEIVFSRKRLEIMILNGIMSKFVFSIFMRKTKDLEQYCEYNENSADFEYFGFYKLRKENIGQNKVYDIISGLNEKLFDKSFNFI